MPNPSTTISLEKLRQQFDTSPYPRIPLETFPQDPAALYIHSLVTAYYRRDQRVIDPRDQLILDAGCGTGYKSLQLAVANPGAKVVGIDLSETSVQMARDRLAYHNITSVEFHRLALEDLPQLGLEFDYINNDDVLYLVPDPIVGLKAMQSVLKPQGILRTNFHSTLQRRIYFNGQEFFKSIGLMDGAAPETGVELVRQTMKCLKNQVLIKRAGWAPHFETQDESVLANYLLEGDKGWLIPEFFAALETANLEFISMVDWRKWDLRDLFTDIGELPLSIVLSLSDLWCGHLGESGTYTPVAEWTDDQWRMAKAQFHPQLHRADFREELVACAAQLRSCQVSDYLRLDDAIVTLDQTSSACLLPLLEGAQSVTALIERCRQLRPLHPVTLESTTEADVLPMIQVLLSTLQEKGYVLLEAAL
jgi:SAM-dependent methyltransferase